MSLIARGAPGICILLGVLLTGAAAADHVAILACKLTESGGIEVVAIDASPGLRAPTRSSISRSCSQVIHELVEGGYTLLPDTPATEIRGALVFVLRGRGTK